jgi:hypothetical protein
MKIITSSSKKTKRDIVEWEGKQYKRIETKIENSDGVNSIEIEWSHFPSTDNNTIHHYIGLVGWVNSFLDGGGTNETPFLENLYQITLRVR